MSETPFDIWSNIKCDIQMFSFRELNRFWWWWKTKSYMWNYESSINFHKIQRHENSEGCEKKRERTSVELFLLVGKSVQEQNSWTYGQDRCRNCHCSLPVSPISSSSPSLSATIKKMTEYWSNNNQQIYVTIQQRYIMISWWPVPFFPQFFFTQQPCQQSPLLAFACMHEWMNAFSIWYCTHSPRN